MRRQLLRSFGPEVEVWPEPPKPPQLEDSYQGPAKDHWGRDRCFQCGRPLCRNNKSHVCTACQRKFGLATLRRRNRPLQQWHLSRCKDNKCQDPAHWADCIPVRPRRPKRPSRSKARSSILPGPVFHSVLLDRVTSECLAGRARAVSAERGCRIAKTDLIRQAIREYLANHPDSEFFVDAVPGNDAHESD